MGTVHESRQGGDGWGLGLGVVKVVGLFLFWAKKKNVESGQFFSYNS